MFAGPGAPTVEGIWRGRLVSVDPLGEDLRVELRLGGGVPRAARRRNGPAIEDAIAAIGRGEIVIVVDDEDRENEGDLVMAAEAATPEKIAFFLAHTSGVICVPVTARAGRPARAPADGDGQHRVPADRLHRRASTTATGTTTGISAEDRAATIQALIDPHTRPPT